MLLYPKELRYSQRHIWVHTEGATARVGVSEDLQDVLGQIESVDLPSPGEELEIEKVCIIFHLKKRVYPLSSPLSGRVLTTNVDMIAQPGAIFISPYGTGWLFTMEYDEPEELDLLMDADEYTCFLE